MSSNAARSPALRSSEGFGLDAESGHARTEQRHANRVASPAQNTAGYGLSVDLQAGPRTKDGEAGYGLTAETDIANNQGRNTSDNRPARPRMGEQAKTSNAFEGAGDFGLEVEQSAVSKKQLTQQSAKTAGYSGSDLHAGGSNLPQEVSYGSMLHPVGESVAATVGSPSADNILSHNRQTRPRMRPSPKTLDKQPCMPHMNGSAGIVSLQAGDMHSHHNPRVHGAGPTNLQEIVHNGLPYLLDKKDGTVYREAVTAYRPAARHLTSSIQQCTGNTSALDSAIIQAVGRWVGGRVVLTPQLKETDFYTKLAGFLQAKGLALEDVFAALDTDLDGCLTTSGSNSSCDQTTSQLGQLIMDVLPVCVPPSQLALLCGQADMHGSGAVSFDDLIAAGQASFQADAEVALGPASIMTQSLHRVVHKLLTQQEHAQQLVQSLGFSRTKGWLEMSQWLSFLRAMCPDLTAVELRYTLCHMYSPLDDDRRSLAQVMQSLVAADEHYVSEARLGRGPRNATTVYKGPSSPNARQSSPVRADFVSSGSPHGSVGLAAAQPATLSQHAESVMLALRKQGALLADANSVALTGSPRMKTATGSPAKATQPPNASASNPRGAVARWFSALADYLKHHHNARGKGHALSDLMVSCDANSDSCLNAVELATLMKRVLPSVTAAQAVYIKAVLNPNNNPNVSIDEVLHALTMFSSAGPAAQGSSPPAHSKQQIHALQLLSDWMHANKVQLQTIMVMFDSNNDGYLNEEDLYRLLKHIQPSLTAAQLNRCLAQLCREAGLDSDGRISLQDLRLALQGQHSMLATNRAAAQQAAQLATLNDAAVGGDSSPRVVASWTLQDPSYLPAVLNTTAPGMQQQGSRPASCSPGNSRDKQPANTSSPTAHKTAGILQTHPVAGGHVTCVLPITPINTRIQRGSHAPVLLDPLTYCNTHLLHDPVSNLVYLPVRHQPGAATHGTPVKPTGGDLSKLQHDTTLLLFGRLRPDKHVQRVETAPAAAFFTALDQQLKACRCTVADLLASHTRVSHNNARPGSSGSPAGRLANPILDLIGLSQLVQSMVPSWAGLPGMTHYYMALFDSDGDGWVTCDDIMNAFEETGTSIGTLQTPAHLVHAHAYKLLASLASYVHGSTFQEQEAHQMFQEYSQTGGDALLLPELARFVADMSCRAAAQQAATQQDIVGQPTALPVQVLTSIHQSPAVLGASSDDVGAVCVYFASRVMGANTTLTWSAMTQVLQHVSNKFPTKTTDQPTSGSPRAACVPTSTYAHGNHAVVRGHGALGMSHVSSNLPALPWQPANNKGDPGYSKPTQYHVGMHEQQRPQETQYTSQVYAQQPMSAPYSGLQQQQQQHAVPQLASPTVHHTTTIPTKPFDLTNQRPQQQLRWTDQYNIATSCAPAPGRREVQLVMHVMAAPAAQGVQAQQQQQQILLLDMTTGLLYNPPPLPMSPAYDLQYLSLAGKLTNAAAAWQPAPLPCLYKLFSVLAMLSTDPYQLKTHYQLLDRDGKGLELAGFVQLVKNLAGQPVCSHLPLSHYDLLHASLDVTGEGRVTFQQLTQGLSKPVLNSWAAGRPAPATTAELRAHCILHDAAVLLSSSLPTFWLMHSRLDTARLGYLDLDSACGLLCQLMPGIPETDKEVMYAYIGAVCPSHTAVSPDELLQLMHVLPLRYEPQEANGTSHVALQLLSFQCSPGFLPSRQETFGSYTQHWEAATYEDMQGRGLRVQPVQTPQQAPDVTQRHANPPQQTTDSYITLQPSPTASTQHHSNAPNMKHQLPWEGNDRKSGIATATYAPQLVHPKPHDYLDPRGPPEWGSPRAQGYEYDAGAALVSSAKVPVNEFGLFAESSKQTGVQGKITHTPSSNIIPKPAPGLSVEQFGLDKEDSPAVWATSPVATGTTTTLHRDSILRSSGHATLEKSNSNLSAIRAPTTDLTQSSLSLQSMQASHNVQSPPSFNGNKSGGEQAAQTPSAVSTSLSKHAFFGIEAESPRPVQGQEQSKSMSPTSIQPAAPASKDTGFGLDAEKPVLANKSVKGASFGDDGHMQETVKERIPAVHSKTGLHASLNEYDEDDDF